MKNKSDLVSIIVPVYNVEGYLIDCIDSILHQTYHNIEIILVNDGSSDKSGKICDNYVEKNTNKIKVIHKQNEGLNYARRDGFLVSHGNYVVFVDSDDVISKRFIEILKQQIDYYGADVAVSGYRNFKDINTLDLKLSDNLAVKYEDNKQITLNWLIEGGAPWNENIYLMTAWGKLYKRELIKLVNWDFSNYKSNEDEFWSLQIFNNVHHGIVFTDSLLYGYRQNQHSITQKKYINSYKNHRMTKFDFIGHLYEKSFEYLGADFSKPLVHRLGFNIVDFIDMYTDKNSMNISNIMSAQRVLTKYSKTILNNQPSIRVAKKIKSMNRLGVLGYVLNRRFKAIL